MPAFTFVCPNCGATLKFDPEKQMFVCEFCDSTFSEDVLTARSAEEEKKAKAKSDRDEARAREAAEGYGALYICPNCGAEIVVTDTTAATTCYYCHSPVVLSGRLEDAFRPDYVIPFSVSKEEARKQFFQWVSKKKFVPKDAFSEQVLDSVTGVYFPYWMADYDSEVHFSGQGTRVTTTTTRDYIVKKTDYYEITRDATVHYEDVMRSALKKADRKLADGVHPFHAKDIEGFASGYLSGFMAEKRDTEAEEVRPDIEAELTGYTRSLLLRGTSYSSITGTDRTDFTGKDYKYILLPAWILTYKAKDSTIYTYAMNGQTGSLCGKLPLDKGKLFGAACLLGAAVALACYLIGGMLL